MTVYTTLELVRVGLTSIGEKNITDEYITDLIESATSGCDLCSSKDPSLNARSMQ